jgi:hypothetical protein
MSYETFVSGAEPWGSGMKAALGALRDEALLETLQRYKRQVAKRYRVVEPDIIEQILPSEELFLSPKLDGELWFLLKKGDDVALAAYNGRVLVDVAPLKGVKEHFAKSEFARLNDFVVAGELVATMGTERPRSFHVGTSLNDPQGENVLSFHAFDLVSENSEDRLGIPYETRHAWLEKHLGSLPETSKIRVVLTERGDPMLVAQRYREWVLGNRFEGVVVRSQRGLTYKIKPTMTIDVVVVAFGERVTGDVRQVRELQVGLFRDDGSVQLVGSVGNGLSEDDRARWHAKLAAIESPSAFRLANREGTLCRFVRPEVVIEMRVSDLLVSDAWDAPLRRMALSYSAEKGYAAVAELRTVVPLHPVLVRERTDKKADATDVGMNQIASHLDETGADPVRSTGGASAEVVARAVFTKETKGLIAVRKYAVIRTNKEGEGTHPPFVAFFSDFSPGRKEPLQTALRTGASLEDAHRHVDAWLVENVKKGWSQAGAVTSGSAPVAMPEAPPEKPTKAKATKAAKAAPEAAEATDAPTGQDPWETAGEAPVKKKRASKKAE